VNTSRGLSREGPSSRDCPEAEAGSVSQAKRETHCWHDPIHKAFWETLSLPRFVLSGDKRAQPHFARLFYR
jgi:hypothetical protein